MIAIQIGKIGRKPIDVGGKRSGLDLWPVTKPPQHDPGIYSLN